MVFVVAGCLWFVVQFVVFVDCCLLFGVWCLMCVVVCCVARCLLFVVCRLWFVVSCVLLLFDVCCSFVLFVVCLFAC